jgi:hypothetical protein
VYCRGKGRGGASGYFFCSVSPPPSPFTPAAFKRNSLSCTDATATCLTVRTTFSVGRPPFLGHFALQQKAYAVAGSLHDCTTCKLLDHADRNTKHHFSELLQLTGQTAEWLTPQTWGVACPMLRPGNGLSECHLYAMQCVHAHNMGWVGRELSQLSQSGPIHVAPISGCAMHCSSTHHPVHSTHARALEPKAA